MCARACVRAPAVGVSCSNFHIINKINNAVHPLLYKTCLWIYREKLAAWGNLRLLKFFNRSISFAPSRYLCKWDRREELQKYQHYPLKLSGFRTGREQLPCRDQYKARAGSMGRAQNFLCQTGSNGVFAGFWRVQRICFAFRQWTSTWQHFLCNSDTLQRIVVLHNQIQLTSVITDPKGSKKLYVITEVRHIRGSVNLLFNITFKFIPLKLRLFSVLLHMDMKSYILHTQKHTLLHSWTLDITDGSTTHQDAWLLPSFTHLLYYTTYKKFLNPPLNGATAPRGSGPPHYRGFAITLRRTTLL
jgi:hypothetical protein